MSRNFPDWIKAYMTYSSHSEAPNSFHFWTAISVLAGALRRRVWMDQGYFQWTPNFYIVFVAPPGIVSKSTTASIGMNLLKQIPGVHFGPDAVTWQSLVQSMATSTETFQPPNSNIEDPMHIMSAITISSSEFGNFLNPKDREMVDLLVSLWDGQKGAWKKATKTQGSDHIENPWINIIACTTPAWIAGNFPEYMIGGGFTSRCVFVYGQEKRQLIAYPKYHIPPDFKAQEEKLVEDLAHIAMDLVGEYELNKEAHKWGVNWYQEHYSSKPKDLDDERFGGYLARKQTHIHKLAMVLAAAKSSNLIITQHDLESASKIITTLEANMPLVFSHIGRSEETKQADGLVHYVNKVGRIEKSTLYRRSFTSMTWKDFNTAIDSARAAGFVRLEQDGASLMVVANRS